MTCAGRRSPTWPRGSRRCQPVEADRATRRRSGSSPGCGAWREALRCCALRDHFERIRLRGDRSRSCAHATDEERERAERLTRALVNRLLHAPMLRLKDADAGVDDGLLRLQAAHDLFALGRRSPTAPESACLSAPSGSDAGPAAWRCWQTDTSSPRLEPAGPACRCERVPIRTLGDRVADVPLPRIGDRGLFTSDIEDALRGGDD